LVEEEGEAHPDESIDQFELENRLLTEDEKKIIHDAIISHEKEMIGGQHREIGEGSGVEHHTTILEITAPPSLEPVSEVDSQSVPGYDPEQPRLSPIREHASESALPSASQTEEVTLNISQ
jgi:hypothetical protein